MKRLNFIIVLFLLSFIAKAQQFADKKFYLVDSLDLSEISKQEGVLLDSILSIYHQTNKDSSKFKLVNELATELSLKPRLKYLTWLSGQLESTLQKKHSKKDQKKYEELIGSTYANLGTTYVHANLLSQALNYSLLALEQAKRIKNFKIQLTSYATLDYIYRLQGEYSKSFDICNEWLLTLEQVDDKESKTRCYNSIGAYYYMQDQEETAIEYYSKSLNLAKEINNKQLMANALGNIGQAHQFLSNHSEALKYYQEGYKIDVEIDDKRGIWVFLLDMGNLYFLQGKYSEALSKFYEGLKVCEEINDLQGKSSFLSNIGKIYDAQEEYDKALKIYHRSIKVQQEMGLKRNVANSLYNIANTYLNLHDFDNTITYAQKCLKVREEIADSVGMGNINILMGIAWKNKGETEKAINYLEKGLKLISEKNNDIGLALALGTLAEIFFDKNQNEKANDYAQRAYKVAIQSNVAKLKKQAALIYYKTSKKRGDYKKSIEAYELYVATKDSMSNESNTKSIIQQEAKYEYEKQKALDDAQHQNELAMEVQAKQQKQTIIYFSIGGLIILILLLMIIFNRLKTTRQQKQIIEEQARKLQELDETKTKFFNNVAHELRTPLTLMTGHMESMLNERFGGLNENQRKSVQVAKNNSTRLMELVSEILDLGKLESNKLELNSRPVAVKPFLDRLFFTFESLAYQFDIQLEYNYKLDESLTLLIDDKKIEKAINNLVYNAIKFTPRGGNVALNVSQDQQQILIEVTDTGRGIAKEELSRIFERYFQSADKNAPAQGGTGIGLAIVKEFIELHNGKVHVKSEIGKGSQFTLALPLSLITTAVSEVVAGQEDKEEFPQYPILEGKNATILIVEDHKEMQQYLKDILSDYAKILIANDGKEALELLDKNKVDLATIDVMMPNMDGFALLKKMKNDPIHCRLPLIMLTARSAEEDKLDALRIGVNDYITKPFNQQELIARIANLLENQLERGAAEEETTEPHKDDEFLNKLNQIVLDHLSDSNFNVAELALQIGISEKQLTRNLKRITGLTPLKFIREIKLLKAQELLKSKTHHTVAEVCYAVGFEKPGYFTQLYTARFGKKPSDYFI